MKLIRTTEHFERSEIIENLLGKTLELVSYADIHGVNIADLHALIDAVQATPVIVHSGNESLQ